MKKFIAGFIAGAMLFGALGVFAAVGLRDVRIADTVSLWVHGRRVETDIIHAVRYDNPYGFGRNYVSARDLAEALGYFVDWCGDTNRILVTRYAPQPQSQTWLDPALNWGWVQTVNNAHGIVFVHDGTGFRWSPSGSIAFEWNVPESGLVRLGLEDGYIENWNYIVGNNSLTMTDPQNPDWSFSFRIADGAHELPQAPGHTWLLTHYPENPTVPAFANFLGRPHMEVETVDDRTVIYVYELDVFSPIYEAVFDDFEAALVAAGFVYEETIENEDSAVVVFRRNDTMLMLVVHFDTPNALGIAFTTQ